MKLKATIISIVSVLIIGLTAILLYCFWPAIKGTVDNSKYYTQEELQESYDKGYNDGCKTETELTGQVKYYKSLVDEYYIQVNTLNDEITMLTKTKKDYETQIANIESQKANLQIQVNNLTTIKTNNETTIASLNSQITSLQNQVTNLTNSVDDKSEQIATLNSQITTLNTRISELEASGEEKDNEISSLKKEVKRLQDMASVLEDSNASKENQIAGLNSQILNLQNTISQLQTTNNMNVATITSLNTQIANLNTQISDMTLQSQNSQGQINALNNKISELQASVSYYESFISQLENGEQVVATFEYDGSVYNIQIVNKGSKLSVTTPTSTTYKIFNCWTVNGSAIDLSTYTITTNTKIVADVTYKYDVKFKVDNTIYNSQIITKNNCATLPTNPTKDGYEFDGWSLNGVDVISDITTKQVTENTTYFAVFTKLHNVTFMVNGEVLEIKQIRNGEYVSNINTNYVWTLNGNNVNFNEYAIFADVTFVSNTQFNVLVEKSWNGFNNIVGEHVWTDGENIYCSFGNRGVDNEEEQYILDKATSTWKEKTWNGSNDYFGGNIWTDGENIYYSNRYGDNLVLDKATSTWNIKTWNGLTDFSGSDVWTDGENIYYSSGSSQYVLDKATSTWKVKTWNGFAKIYGNNIWTDGKNIYYSSYDNQYVLDKATSTWKVKTWNGFTNFYGKDVWTDGENYYYSDGNIHYIFVMDYNI